MKDLFETEINDEIVPGGCAEAVLHIPAIVVIVVLIPTPAY